jgi:hypothetical protein
MLGLQKGTVNINLFNADTNEFSNVDAVTAATDDMSSLTAIYANPGKQFQTVQVTFDINVAAANVESTIQDAINVWIAAYGARYDDMKLNINNSGGGTHDITIVITRNY